MVTASLRMRPAGARAAKGARLKARAKAKATPKRQARAKSIAKQKPRTQCSAAERQAAPEASPLRQRLMQSFAELVKAAPLTGVPPRKLQKLRKTLLEIARDARRRDAAAACSLLLFTEVLADPPPHAVAVATGLPQAPDEDGRVSIGACCCPSLPGCPKSEAEQAQAFQAAATRLRLMDIKGREGWDAERVTAQELLEAIPEATPRQLCVLHRLVSLAAGKKHGAPSPELAALSGAAAAAQKQRDPEGCCCVCLTPWSSGSPILVFSCGHALHVDCFGSLVSSPAAPALRGRCRTCKQPTYWGPLTGGNLRCTMAAAGATSFARACTQGEALDPGAVALMCMRIAQEMRVGPEVVWEEFREEAVRSGLHAVGRVKTTQAICEALAEAVIQEVLDAMD